VDQGKQIRSAVVDLAVNEKLKRRPYHRKIAIDSHKRIMNAFLDVRCSRFSDTVGECFNLLPAVKLV
jgi:hypothetical protein